MAAQIAQPEHDVDHLAKLINAQTRVRVGTVTGTLTGFRSGQTLAMLDDDGQTYAMPWTSDLLQLEKIDADKLAQAQAAQEEEHRIALQAKRTVFERPDYLELSPDEVAEAVRLEIERGTVSS